MKKKILIVNNNMHIGGVQKALVNLLWNIREQYDVTLLLLYKGGALLQELPGEIHVACAGGAWRYIGMTKDDCRTVLDYLARAFFAAIARLLGRRFAVDLMCLGQKPVSGYETAVSYLHNSGDKVFYGGCNEFVLRHVKNAKIITFLHCDYVKCGADTHRNGKQYAMFDDIAACSQGCRDSFLSVHPELKDRVRVVSNCHRYEKIREEAETDKRSFSQEKINILTVARLGKEKGVERAIRAIGQLGESRSSLHYYIVGDGIQRPVLERLIGENNLYDVVTLCGELKNPYGYIQAADLLLIPSYSEAAPLVIGEAVSLGTPVLSTETSSAREMIERTGYGWVCLNTDDAIRAALEQLLSDPAQLELKKDSLAERKWNDASAAAAFCVCLDQ